MAVAVALYLVSATLVIAGRICYNGRERLLIQLAHAIDQAGAAAPDDQFRRARIATVLAGSNARAVERAIAEGRGSLAVQHSCAEWLVDTRGEAHLLALAARGRPRWRRIAALRTLAMVHSDRGWDLLSAATNDRDRHVARSAVAILGEVPHLKCSELLIKVLRRGRWPRSQVAAFLLNSPVRAEGLFDSLLDDADPGLRYWGAVLAATHVDAPATQARLIALAADANSAVRWAVLKCLGDGGVMAAIPVSRDALNDPVAAVRSQAVATFGRLAALDAAPLLAAKLCDDDWTVRDAVKRVLLALGRDAEPVLFSHLTDADGFARNNTAETLQHLGTFERLLIEEANGAPDDGRRASLVRLADAGGMRVWQAVLAHLPDETQRRLSATLNVLGLRAAAAEENA